MLVAWYIGLSVDKKKRSAAKLEVYKAFCQVDTRILAKDVVCFSLAPLHCVLCDACCPKLFFSFVDSGGDLAYSGVLFYLCVVLLFHNQSSPFQIFPCRSQELSTSKKKRNVVFRGHGCQNKSLP